MASNVISYDSSETGTKKAYLRVVDGDSDEVTLPLTQAGPQHKSFILATWVKSYQSVLRKWLGAENLREFSAMEAKQAETLWGRTCIVGAPDDDFVVHAWVCGSPGRLDYVYVPPELRGKGVARALIHHVCGYTFEYGRPWPFRKAPSGGTYNPYLLGNA